MIPTTFPGEADRWVRPVVLEGPRVRIEPLDRCHTAGVFRAGTDPDTWRWMPRRAIESEGDAAGFIDAALAGRARGEDFPFAIIDRASGELCGSTRFLAIRPEHRGLEIGWTWLGTPWRRTGINRECKLLLLTHAFETLQCIRVEFKTDIANTRSQNAMKAIGCVPEGVFRQHRLRPDGTLRDTTWFSIIDSEWPAVKQRLEDMLSRHG